MKGTEMHIANDSSKIIFAMVCGDKESILKRGFGFNIGVNDIGIGFNANKESHWEFANLIGFTKIMPGYSIALYPIADKHTVYVTIFTEDREEVCSASPICENWNVIVNPLFSLQNARKNTIWEYEPSRKSEVKGKTDANFDYEKERLVSYNNELLTKIEDLEKRLAENNNNNNNDKVTSEQNKNNGDSERSNKINRQRSYEMANKNELKSSW